MRHHDSTNPKIFEHALTPEESLGLVDSWLELPPVTVVHPTHRHAAVLRELLTPLGTAGNLTSDAHLAALAIEHGATLCSCDNDFSWFAGLKWVDPLAGGQERRGTVSGAIIPIERTNVLSIGLVCAPKRSHPTPTEGRHSMIHPRLTRGVACLAVVCGLIAAPTTGASASEASIQRVIASYGARIDIAEGHVLAAVGVFKENEDPAPLDAAIARSVAVLRGLRAKVGRQAAIAPNVKRAKTKIEGGLHYLIVAYGQLVVAYNELSTNQEAATKEAEAAVALTRTGHDELVAGVNQLR